MVTRHQNILWGHLFGCENLLNFTCITMKFHNYHHTTSGSKKISSKVCQIHQRIWPKTPAEMCETTFHFHALSGDIWKMILLPTLFTHFVGLREKSGLKTDLASGDRKHKPTNFLTFSLILTPFLFRASWTSSLLGVSYFSKTENVWLWLCFLALNSLSS